MCDAFDAGTRDIKTSSLSKDNMTLPRQQTSLYTKSVYRILTMPNYNCPRAFQKFSSLLNTIKK